MIPKWFLAVCLLLRYLTGQVNKYEREAKEKNRETWYLSWALDTNQEERDKVGPQQTCEPIKFRKLYIGRCMMYTSLVAQ